MNVVFIVILSGCIGLIMGWLWASLVYSIKKAKWRASAEENERLLSDLKTSQEKIITLTAELASSQARIDSVEKKWDEQKTKWIEMQNTLTLQFKNLAHDIFEDKSKRFTEQNKINIDSILSPLNKNISEFKNQVNQVHQDSIKQGASLGEQLNYVIKNNQQLSKGTENLTNALQGNKQKQGAWGEFILESVLEKSGLTRGREYVIQPSFRVEEGNQLRPDVLVNLPDNKTIVVDSKVSLTAYNNYVNATSKEDAEKAIKNHLISIQQHMDNLSKKNYPHHINGNNLEFTVMFVPIESAYLAAIQHDHMLYEKALEKRLLFVCPTLFIPLLQLIKNLWKQEDQTRNIKEIVMQATKLHDQFVSFISDLDNIKKHLDSSQQAYSSAMKRLSTGNGNLVRRVNNIKELGIPITKEINRNLIDRSKE